MSLLGGYQSLRARAMLWRKDPPIGRATRSEYYRPLSPHVSKGKVSPKSVSVDRPGCGHLHTRLEQGPETALGEQPDASLKVMQLSNNTSSLNTQCRVFGGFFGDAAAGAHSLEGDSLYPVPLCCPCIPRGRIMFSRAGKVEHPPTRVQHLHALHSNWRPEMNLR